MTLEDRARRLLNTAPHIATPPAVAGGSVVAFLMGCSLYQRPFVIVAEQRDHQTLRLLRNELLQAGGGAVSAPADLGAFRFDSGMWPGCPHCGAFDNPSHALRLLWSCGQCQAWGRPSFNCAGCDSAGRFRCNCGAVVTGPFELYETLEVYGARHAAISTPPPRLEGSGVLRPPPAVPEFAAPRVTDTSPLLRLPWRR